MANRFKDTEIWSEDWFTDLGGEYMLFWDFITAKCDNAGVWKPNKTDFETKTKFKVNLDSFFVKVNGDKQRILLLENGRWFVPGFISYQWFTKKETFDLVLSNRLHKSLYEILLKNKISLKKVRGLKEVLQRPMDMVMEKEFKDEERGVGKGEGFFCSEITKDLLLTPLEVELVKEFITITAQKNLKNDDINSYWKAFKIDNFRKNKWYADHEDLIGHFRHSLKLELKNGLKNGYSKIADKGKSTGALELLEEIRADFRDNTGGE